MQLSEYATDVISDDNSYPKECAIRTYLRLMNSAAAKIGRVMNVAHTLKGIAEEVGFTNASQKLVKLPWAPWPSDPKMKELGRFALLNCETSFEAFGLALLTRVHEMSAEEALELCQDARKELRNKRIHIYNLQYAPFFSTDFLWVGLMAGSYLIIAQKPLKDREV